MAKLADAQVLGTCAFGRMGSTPFTRIDRQLVAALARQEWERDRRDLEPHWENLPVEVRVVWLKNVEDLVKRLRRLEAELSASGE